MPSTKLVLQSLYSIESLYQRLLNSKLTCANCQVEKFTFFKNKPKQHVLYVLLGKEMFFMVIIYSKQTYKQFICLLIPYSIMIQFSIVYRFGGVIESFYIFFLNLRLFFLSEKIPEMPYNEYIIFSFTLYNVMLKNIYYILHIQYAVYPIVFSSIQQYSVVFSSIQ